MALKFLKTGADSVALAQKQAAMAEMAKTQQGKMWSFFLKEKETAKITFVDGDLNDEGLLLPPRCYEHSLFLNGTWGHYYVCPVLTSPEMNDFCPNCESGDKAYLAAFFTVIDHRQFTSQKGVVYQNTRKIMRVKPTTFEILSKIAAKRNGLACCTFDVSRVGEKSAAVGSMFDFDCKRERKDLEAMFVQEFTDPKTNVKSVQTLFKAADYEQEIVYRTGKELVALGLGKPQPQVASPDGSSGKQIDYASQM